jgi:hypothetical protein
MVRGVEVDILQNSLDDVRTVFGEKRQDGVKAFLQVAVRQQQPADVSSLGDGCFAPA